jgi:aspartate kinase
VRIIQKFGGTSVADIRRLERVSLKVKQEVDQGHHVAVVVSAMAGVTNHLVGQVKALAGDALSSEYDTVVSTGEQITTGLLALALQQIGIPARSFLGWQIPVVTDTQHGNAKIQSVNPSPLEACWEQGIVPVISGFQGITQDQRITTLGRGGSDTTAVAVAAALQADRCDIYTDVDGVYTADPRLIPNARKLDTISYSEMLDLASLGAKVLHAPCVEIAQTNAVRLIVRSSFHGGDGTEIVPHGEGDAPRISGITHTSGWVLLKLFSHRPLPPQANLLKTLLRERSIDAEIIPPRGGQQLILLPQSSLATILHLIDTHTKIFDFVDPSLENSLARIGIVGLNLNSTGGYQEELIKLINRENLPLTIVSLTPHKFCLCASESLAPELLRTLHDAFKLDQTIDANIEKSVATGM